MTQPLNQSFMQREIHEQPDVLTRICDNEMQAIEKLSKEISKRDIRYLVIAARGTSDHAATYAKYVFEIENGLPVSLAAPSVHTLYQKTPLYRDALVIGISQSGESPDVMAVVEAANKYGALTASITNDTNSALAKMTHFPLNIHAQKEQSVAATKTYTGTLAVILALSQCLKQAASVRDTLDTISKCMRTALQMDDYIQEAAERYRFMEECVVIARGLNQATAAEAALKLIETCYVLAKPYSSADFLHGPFALVRRGFPVIMYAPAGASLETLRDVTKKLKDSGAEIFAVTPDDALLDLAVTKVKVNYDIEEIFSPLTYVLYAQLFACHLAVSRGFDPDKPRGLTKVTRTL